MSTETEAPLTLFKLLLEGRSDVSTYSSPKTHSGSWVVSSPEPVWGCDDFSLSLTVNRFKFDLLSPNSAPVDPDQYFLFVLCVVVIHHIDQYGGLGLLFLLDSEFQL